MAAAAPPRPTRPPDLAWEWRPAAAGALCAVPAAVLITSDVSAGLALAVGVLPASIVGVAPTRRERRRIFVVGALTGVCMLVGGALSAVPVLAVAAVALLGVGTALLAARTPLGQVAMTLALPLVGIGLSYSDLGEAAAAAGLMVCGGLYACLLAMLWPEREPAPRPARPPGGPTLEYGIRLGAAGATAAAIGFLAGLEHVGWATAAALLVMRPVAEMQRLRSAGRIAAVLAGAVAAIALLDVSPSAQWYALAAIVAVAGAAGTHGSRWYVTPAFTTFLVFLLLLYADRQDTEHRLLERLGETLLGVGIAYFFGLVVPRLRRRSA